MDGVVDEDEKFVDDGTGMHPTRTTYIKTEVAYSATQPTTYATPTPDRYHAPRSTEDFRIYNRIVSDELEFSELEEVWANYQPHEYNYDGTTWTDGSTRLQMWKENFKPRYSWDFTSPLTDQSYFNICPTIIFYDAAFKPKYYFFEVIFNDHQAAFGYDSWSSKLDGKPGVLWPGMVEVVDSMFGNTQRPKQRVKYENWFHRTYQGGIANAAPLWLVSTKISYSLPPSRFRRIDSTGRVRRDDFPADPEPKVISGNIAEQLMLADGLTSLPSFNNNVAVPLGGAVTFVRNASSSAIDYTTKWLKCFSSPVAAAFVGQAATVKTQALAQVSPVSIILADLVDSNYIGYQDVTQFTMGATWSSWFSPWLRVGNAMQLTGWVLNTGGVNGGQLFTTGYGFTSVSPTASKSGATKYVLKSSSTQEEILAQMRLAVGQGSIGFVYDASVGTYGEVSWISQV